MCRKYVPRRNRPPDFTVNESFEELEALLKAAENGAAVMRLRALIEMKGRLRGCGVRRIAKALEVDSGSVSRWRRAYMNGGIDALLSDGRRKKTGTTKSPERGF